MKAQHSTAHLLLPSPSEMNEIEIPYVNIPFIPHHLTPILPDETRKSEWKWKWMDLGKEMKMEIERERGNERDKQNNTHPHPCPLPPSPNVLQSEKKWKRNRKWKMDKCPSRVPIKKNPITKMMMESESEFPHQNKHQRQTHSPTPFPSPSPSPSPFIQNISVSVSPAVPVPVPVVSISSLSSFHCKNKMKFQAVDLVKRQTHQHKERKGQHSHHFHHHPIRTPTLIPLPVPISLSSSVFIPPIGSHCPLPSLPFLPPSIGLSIPNKYKYSPSLFRDSLVDLQFVSQLNKKYLLAKNSSDSKIFLLDQHAADERIQLEKLTKNMKNHLGKHFLGQKIRINLSQMENKTLISFQNVLNQWGWRWEREGEEDQGDQRETQSEGILNAQIPTFPFHLHHPPSYGPDVPSPSSFVIFLFCVPTIYGIELNEKDFCEFLETLRGREKGKGKMKGKEKDNEKDQHQEHQEQSQSQPSTSPFSVYPPSSSLSSHTSPRCSHSHSLCPSLSPFLSPSPLFPPPIAIHRILSSLSCHHSVRFGDFVSPLVGNRILRDISQCKLPFNCAHGRPTVTVIWEKKKKKDKDHHGGLDLNIQLDAPSPSTSPSSCHYFYVYDHGIAFPPDPLCLSMSMTIPLLLPLSIDFDHYFPSDWDWISLCEKSEKIQNSIRNFVG